MGRSAIRAFHWPVRIYYEDTDSGGVVYHANYLKFMERARTEWLRAEGFEQTALASEHRVMFVVREVRIEYLKPARFDDLLDVSVELHELRRSSVVLAQAVHCGELLARAEAKLVCVDHGTFKPVRIPQSIKQQLEGTP
jgi:acyl-CoA thioester hydrolase